MGLVVATSLSYATIADIRAFGVPDSVTDDQITTALDLAVDLVTDYTGTFFGAPVSMDVVINDVRKPLVVLPTPFAAVTAVTVNGTALNPNLWVLENWGLRIYSASYYDPDGFPRWSLSNVNNGLNYGDTLYGGQVVVTATFGWPDVPAKVRRATILLAARAATQTIADLAPDPRLKLLQVEGYRAAWDTSLFATR